MQIDSILIGKSLNEYACIFKLLPVAYVQICKLNAFNNIAFQNIRISLSHFSEEMHTLKHFIRAFKDR